MADDFDSRTEPASPRRREEARQQGRVAISGELIRALVLLAGVAALVMQTPGLGGTLVDMLRTDLAALFRGEMGPAEAGELLAGQVGRGLHLIGLFLGVLLAAGVGASVLQVGFRIVPERLAPDFGRLSPAGGLQKLFSWAAVVRGGMSLLRVSALAVLAYVVVKGRTGLLASLGQGSVAAAASQGWDLALRLALTIAAALFVLGAIDYGFQWFRFERALRMTRQEVKEEQKREEGDPLIRNRIRQVQREMARRRMMAAVPKATVVITNPTHLAVALRYERGVTKAPRVVAKGAGHVALRIVELARRHGVPIVERRPVAQALFKAVKVEQEIPAALFYAVAEVLAYLYRLRTGAA